METTKINIKNLDRHALNVVQLLKEQNLKISFAESCTGGLLAQRITSVAGASEVFEIGLVTYSERAKIEVLGVPASVIEKHGAVSSVCAGCMACALGVGGGGDLNVSVTGLAGPSGDGSGTKVGTVYAGFHRQKDGENEFFTASFDFSEYKEREEIRRMASNEVLALCERILKGEVDDAFRQLESA
jgi:nicotinamide-nucleotide amidase